MYCILYTSILAKVSGTIIYYNINIVHKHIDIFILQSSIQPDI